MSWLTKDIAIPFQNLSRRTIATRGIPLELCHTYCCNDRYRWVPHFHIVLTIATHGRVSMTKRRVLEAREVVTCMVVIRVMVALRPPNMHPG